MTKQRKILVAGAALAFGLVVADRLLMGGATGPSGAGAATAPPVAEAAAAAVKTPPPQIANALPPRSPDSGPSLAERLEGYRSDLPAQVRDAFAPGEHWTPEQPASSTTAPPAARFDPQRFARDHPVAATYVNAGQRQAIIDGKIARPGLESQGMVLIEIGDRWVLWQGHGVKVRVHVGPGR